MYRFFFFAYESMKKPPSKVADFGEFHLYLSPSWLSVTSSSSQYCWTRMASQMMSLRWTSKEIGPEYAISKYFELIVNWFLN